MAHLLNNSLSDNAQDFKRRIERAALMGAESEKRAAQESLPDQNQGQCCVAKPNPRQLIEDRINYHNRMAIGLHALLRAIPQEMPFPADDALANLIIGSRPSW